MWLVDIEGEGLFLFSDNHTAARVPLPLKKKGGI
jgi:hypothetical protein